MAKQGLLFEKSASERPEPPVEVYGRDEAAPLIVDADQESGEALFDGLHLTRRALERFDQNPDQFSDSDRRAIAGHLRHCPGKRDSDGNTTLSCRDVLEVLENSGKNKNAQGSLLEPEKE